ncbi:MAG: PAS domain S-box protein, partial [Thermoguttaceae bacterium]
MGSNGEKILGVIGRKWPYIVAVGLMLAGAAFAPSLYGLLQSYECQRLRDRWEQRGERTPIVSKRAVLPRAESKAIASATSWYPLSAAAGLLVLSLTMAANLVAMAKRNAAAATLAGHLAKANRQLTAEIADRKKVEAILREGERQYRLFAENVTDLIWIMDLSGRYAYFSPSIREAIGYTPEEGVGLTIDDMTTRASAAVFHRKLEELGAAFEAGQPIPSEPFEIEKICKDGSRTWGEVTMSAMHDDAGNFVAVQGVTRDITERKHAEERQARCLRRLERVNQLQEELLSPGSLQEKLKKVSEAAVELLDLDFCRIWVVKPGDRCAEGCVHAPPADEHQRCRHSDQCLHLAASSGRRSHLDDVYSRVPFGRGTVGLVVSGTDKKFLTNEATTDPRMRDHGWAKELGLVSFADYKLRDADNKPTGVLAAFAAHRISEEDDAFLSSLAEIASKRILDDQAAQSLLASERRHRLFAENVTEVIWTMDPATFRITYASPSLQQMIGRPWH